MPEAWENFLSLTIISGHQRRQCAIIVGLKEVPVRLIDMPDEDEQLLRLIESNRQREKTMEQKGREYKVRAEVEGRLAKRRMSEGGKGRENSLTLKGQAKDLAAADIGVSRKTADKAAQVVDEIDKAEASGDEERAQELKDSLNNGSVSAAHRKATETTDGGDQKNSEGPPDRWITSLQKDLTSVARRVEVALEKEQSDRGDETASVEKWGQEFLTRLRNARATLTLNKPHTKCKTCKGQKRAKPCSECGGSGWMTKQQAEIYGG
jgi:ParB-like chromosome segregation protein Spo0J